MSYSPPIHWPRLLAIALGVYLGLWCAQLLAQTVEASLGRYPLPQVVSLTREDDGPEFVARTFSLSSGVLRVASPDGEPYYQIGLTGMVVIVPSEDSIRQIQMAELLGRKVELVIRTIP